jgi:PIN domain nuclease of toxin-antitoxin system
LLSNTSRHAIEKARREGGVRVSSISTWEVALLVKRGRLRLSLPVEDWIARNEASSLLQFVPVDNAVAIRSVNLPAPLHPDPADRIIAATALLLGCPLVTKDNKLRDFASLRTIW